MRLVTLRVEAAGVLPPAVPASLQPGRGACPDGHATVHWATGTRETAVYDRGALGAGDELAGPAILTQLDTTTLLPPGWRATVHAAGTLLLRR